MTLDWSRGSHVPPPPTLKLLCSLSNLSKSSKLKLGTAAAAAAIKSSCSTTTPFGFSFTPSSPFATLRRAALIHAALATPARSAPVQPWRSCCTAASRSTPLPQINLRVEATRMAFRAEAVRAGGTYLKRGELSAGERSTGRAQPTLIGRIDRASAKRNPVDLAYW
jgi:hypothetical protein